MRHFHRAAFLSLALATTTMLSGCLGAWDEQPPRYNYVGGGKRSPMLNPGGSAYAPPVEDSMANAELQQQQMQLAQQNPLTRQPANMGMPETAMGMTPPPMAPAAQPQQALPLASQTLEPSPLYYYEQQNAAVDSSDIPPPVATDAMNAPVLSGAGSEPVVAKTSPTEPEISNAPAGLEPSPLAATQTTTERKETALVTNAPEQFTSVTNTPPAPPSADISAAATTEYPDLNQVPASGGVLGDDFANARQDANQFANEVSTSTTENSVVSDATTAPAPVNSLAAEATDSTSQQAVNPEEYVSLDTFEAQQATPSAATPAPVPSTMPPVDLTQQPVQMPANASAPQEVVSEMSVGDASVFEPIPVEPAGNVTPQPAYPATPAGNTYDPAQNTVSVAPAPNVLAEPRPSTIYTSGGPIRLVPPKSIAQRSNTIPESRYSDRRRYYQHSPR